MPHARKAHRRTIGCISPTLYSTRFCAPHPVLALHVWPTALLHDSLPRSIIPPAAPSTKCPLRPAERERGERCAHPRQKLILALIVARGRLSLTRRSRTLRPRVPPWCIPRRAPSKSHASTPPPPPAARSRGAHERRAHPEHSRAYDTQTILPPCMLPFDATALL
ncbi:hypothetical protein B0H15DRAFT_950431 [Mycena belliarum]|uniref:Uncharacterized protein n=1 Tax=Mycena belliarum TaxID=1033014 RepID=A0AAD6U111_9AGAR|nr:hypothetical protein B0H15DRAFT_950431 [Mycena belliae]